ncbi:MAG: TIR domain-containing protein [Vulcanimicrobiaceae bacterium]
MHLRKIMAREQPAQSISPSLTNRPEMQDTLEKDDLGNRIVEYLEQHGSQMPSAAGIASALNVSQDVVRDEVAVLDARGLLKVARPQGYSVADGRFDISDYARALLAQRRKDERAQAAASERTVRLARQLIESDLKADRPELEHSIRNVMAECAAKGILHSGSMIYAVEKQVIASLRQRSERAVETIKRSASRTSVQMSAPNLQAIYDGTLGMLFADGETLVADAVRSSGILNVQQQREQTLEALKVELREKAHAELELFAESIKHGERLAEMPEDSPVSSKVFITHGRDKATRDAVVNFIHSLQLQPIVLEDEPSGGLTIIEKYEKHARVGYGIAILSPDDVGCLKEAALDGLNPRARQNVIFELGYMFASISRHHVAVLLTYPGIERPTNIEGIVWIHLDAGEGWKYKLRKELREAGLPLKD